MKMVKLLVAATVLVTGRLWADTETVNGVAWEYEVSDGEATVTGIPKGTAGALTVPATLGGHPVTTVGDYAFKSCEGLESLAFASASIRLGVGVCENCTSLERVSLPQTVACQQTDPVTSAKDASSPWVNGIPDAAFLGCHALRTIAIPDTTIYIGRFAFAGCWALEGVAIPATLEYLGDFAFGNCESLAQVDVTGLSEGLSAADYLQALIDERLSGDYSIFEFLDEDDINAGYAARSYDFGTALEVVFSRTPWYESLEPFVLTVEGGVVTGFTGACPAHLVIPEGVTEIAESVFDAEYSASPTRIKTVSFPSTLRKIGRWAFYNCSSLESVTLPAGVTTLDEGAFLSCTGLVSVALSPRLETLPPSAFRYCLSLRELTIPASVSFIGERALKECSSLTRLTFEGDAPEIEDDSAFEDLPDSCTVYVSPSSTGWGVEIPGTWRGLQIEYISGNGGNAAGGDGSGTVDAAFGKVQMVQGALYDADGKLAGAVTLKVGKKSKKGIVKISGSVLLLNGKKAAAKAAQLVPGADGSGEVALVFKAPVGAMTLKLSADGTFTCDGSGYTMVKAEVGGAWTTSDAKVCVALADGALPVGARDELLPTAANGGEPITPRGGKWGFAKAAQVKWAKDRTTGDFGLTVNTAGGRTNTSALKLTYAPKTGLFKGSFKVYAVVDNRLKKYTAKVTGLIVDGKGQGTATMTKPGAATWTVAVE